jgi:hypothetical protein
MGELDNDCNDYDEGRRCDYESFPSLKSLSKVMSLSDMGS